MIDMCRIFHTNNLACLKGFCDELCQMLRTGHAVLINILVFCQDLKGYHLLYLEGMSLHHGEADMRIERCREDCYDLSNQQAAGEQLSQKISRRKITFTHFKSCQICLYLRKFLYQRFNNDSLHIDRKLFRQY